MSNAPASYTEVLAPAVAAGINESVESMDFVGTDFMKQANAAAMATFAILDEVDWEHCGLPDRTAIVDGESVTMAPKAYAKHLAVEAFQDAIILMEHCARSVRRRSSIGRRILGVFTRGDGLSDTESNQIDMHDTLVNSKQTLLNQVLGLTDNSKFELYASLRSPSLSKFYLGFRQYEPAIQLVGSAGQNQKFIWGEQISQWMGEHTEPGCGCPARNFLVDTPNRQQPVTYYLWDQLVALRFPEQKRNKTR